MSTPTLDEKFNLTFNIGDVIDKLEPKQRTDILKLVGFDRQLFTSLVEMLASGVTEDGWWFDSRSMDKLREQLVPMMPQVCIEKVRGLIYERNSAEAEQKRCSNWAWRMYHSWPESALHLRPEMEKFESTPLVSEEMATAALA